MNTTCCLSGINELKDQIEELISKSGFPVKDILKDFSNDYRLKDFEESLTPGSIDYTNYWDSFVD
ncbi:hydrolase [Clostridium sp. CX1]|uniref:Hydrolase n=1 Tax=Clostridium tanneri TaxID=3037988 RepID=A0ABU4JNU4_9CLOT|nr:MULTISPECIES: hydrolase [unclassified Clostridium]MCT8976216.1 hydrolase [Clostridium sp. CX1]MDW8799782.1 hydrolase [Clostridium sp. A1-XYC3]